MEFIEKYLDVEKVVTTVVAFLPNLLMALFILIGFWLFYVISSRALRALLTRAGMREQITRLLIDNIYKFAVVAFGLITAAGQVGVNVGAALAGLGVAGIAIGFAAQDSLSNTIAGIMIFWDKPFEVGDWIEVEGEFGHVFDITMRTTRIGTARNTYVVIPNKRIIDAVLVNHSKHGKTRVDVPIGIAYKEDILAAREVMLAAVKKVDVVAQDPAPAVVVTELGNSSVNLQVRVWVDDASHELGAMVGTLEECKIALDAAGIQIPFPHLQLFIDDVQDRVVEKMGLGGTRS